MIYTLLAADAPDVLNPSKIIPTHTVASWLIDIVDKFLDILGLEHHRTLEEIIYVVLIVGLAFAIGWVIRVFLLWSLRKMVKLRKSEFSRQLLSMHTLAKCSHIIPPLVFMALVPFAFTNDYGLLGWLLRIGGIYALIAFGVGMSAVMNFIFYRYDAIENQRNLPIKGVLNIAKGILWIVLVILIVAILVRRSPAVLLTGLGAFAAALMLIFKDSILGFVAGIQMSQNDMLHVGDWIVVPSTPANGTVLDVSLSAVKVQNWDNTIVTVPPYTLVSTCFQNYRGMKDSGARRITKTFTIDLPTIVPLTDEITAAALKAYPILQPFVDKLRTAPFKEQNDGGLTPINGTLETNLGLFRAYCCLYCMNRPGISHTQQLLVRIMDSTENGIPLQIYCFTDTTDWDAYEGIQSSLVEHITVAAQAFSLGIYTAGSLTVETEPSAAPAADSADATTPSAASPMP